MARSFATKRTPRLQSLRLTGFWSEDSGQDLIEYALTLALLGLMCVSALSPVAQVLSNGVNEVEKKFKAHTNHGHEQENNGQHKGWDK